MEDERLQYNERQNNRILEALKCSSQRCNTWKEYIDTFQKSLQTFLPYFVDFAP